MRINYLILLSSLSFLFSQALIREIDKNDLLRSEYYSIQNNNLTDDLFYSPHIQKNNSKNFLNIFSKLNYEKYFQVEPVIALRYSSLGFGMYSGLNELSATPVTWITPGLKIQSTIPIMKGLSNFWLYSWVDFYKHSAYGFNGNDTYVDNLYPLFNYESNYSINFYTPTKSPNNGIDFDEGQAGISLLSHNLQLIFGKYKTNIGPFISGNLSVSDNAPSFPQLMLKANYNKKIYFSYLIGSLNSNISHNYCTAETEADLFLCNVSIPDLYTDEWSYVDDPLHWYSAYQNSIYPSVSNQVYQRYIVNHRLDFMPTNNFRIGIYEQIIFGAKSPPFSYLIPINPLWSSQHSGNDTDNLMMGMDLEYIFKKYRFYSAFLMDEWALFDTFSQKERNWFAYQIGLSRTLNIFDKNSLFKFEYSKVDPRTYRHRYIINQPKHNGYNLGYWSGSDSDNIYANLSVFINDLSIFKFIYQYTRIGAQDHLTILQNQYENEDVDFLGDNFHAIRELRISYTKTLKNMIDLDIEFTNFNTNIFDYSIKDYNDIKIILRYNINY